MTYPDPEVLNQPVEGRVEVERSPSWAEIFILGLILALAIWS